jgi:hypothetical protein
MPMCHDRSRITRFEIPAMIFEFSADFLTSLMSSDIFHVKPINAIVPTKEDNYDAL